MIRYRVPIQLEAGAKATAIRSGDATTQPVGPPLAAVESVRVESTRRAVFDHAKIVHVLEGSAQIETATGIYELTPGAAMTLGAGMWCSVRPAPKVRMWTLYFDESFLRSHMRWVLADASRARRAELIDKMAAAYILQGAIDALTMG